MKNFLLIFKSFATALLLIFVCTVTPLFISEMSANDPNDDNGSVDFRSPQSDIEIPKTRKRHVDDDGIAEAKGAIEVTKANMSTSSRPRNHALTQQKLFGWQPILTPYNVLPVLFILGLIFVPMGIVFLTASMGVQEYSLDYSKCFEKGTSFDNGMRKPADGECELQIQVTKDMKSPIAVYYRLSNFYQNNRLYAKSLSPAQLAGKAILDKSLLTECDPLVHDANDKIYYPCGLVANSFFTDTYEFYSGDGSAAGSQIPISSEGISWPGDENLYKPSQYTIDQVVPPMTWQKLGDYPELNIKDGKYEKIPDLSKNYRFQNWMKISGLPTFRKLYGRLAIPPGGVLKEGLYTVRIKDNYPKVTDYQGTKSFVISTTNWAGGKNDALGIGFIAVGGLLLFLGLLFLIMFMMAPRKVGDVSYLSWYSENSGDPMLEDEAIIGIEGEEGQVLE